jgi:hypothetical protein
MRRFLLPDADRAVGSRRSRFFKEIKKQISLKNMDLMPIFQEPTGAD